MMDKDMIDFSRSHINRSNAMMPLCQSHKGKILDIFWKLIRFCRLQQNGVDVIQCDHILYSICVTSNIAAMSLALEQIIP